MRDWTKLGLSLLSLWKSLFTFENISDSKDTCTLRQGLTFVFDNVLPFSVYADQLVFLLNRFIQFHQPPHVLLVHAVLAADQTFTWF